MRRTYSVGTNLVYARIQELGGEITGKRGGLLTFLGDSGWVRVRSVTIPAQPYLRPAFDAMQAPAAVQVGEVFEKLVLAKHYGA